MSERRNKQIRREVRRLIGERVIANDRGTTRKMFRTIKRAWRAGATVEIMKAQT